MSGKDYEIIAFGSQGLNPYSTGRYSMSAAKINEVLDAAISLNPYSTGRYSMSAIITKDLTKKTQS